MEWLTIIEILLLLACANGAPVLAKNLLGSRYRAPLDGGLCLWDQRPLFGRSKTWRGLVSALLATGAGAVVLGVPFWLGVGFAALAMVGDLLSSFTKRRMGLPSSSKALVLDQVPEALLPILVFKGYFALQAHELVVAVLLFLVAELLVSPVLYRLRWRDRPY